MTSSRYGDDNLVRVWHGKHIESGDKVWGKDYDVEADYDLSHLKKLDHPLLLKFRETFRTGRFFHIVSDSCERFLINDEERNVLEEHEVRVLVRSMVDAWIYLAENGISSNIYRSSFVLRCANDYSTVAFDMFGIVEVQTEMMTLRDTFGILSNFVAPETLTGEQSDASLLYSWSAGICAYRLLCGYWPFYSERIPTLFQSILQCEFKFPKEDWALISPEAVSFITDVIKNSQSKPPIQDIINHPWLSLSMTKNARKNYQPANEASLPFTHEDSPECSTPTIPKQKQGKLDKLRNKLHFGKKTKR